MSVRALEVAVVGIVLATLAASGPAGLLDAPTHRPTALGDGTADAEISSLPADDLRIDRGRFGTGTWYLRVPEATVAVDAVEGTPQVLYRVQVPVLDADAEARRLLGSGDGATVGLAPGDVGLGPDAPDGPVRARVTVAVQSFEVHRTVYDRNVTVEVAR
ncbi:hypothetical protein [Halomicrobium salinisoli]|uniref:hypothetical protein n=1 Tax=Halomicrobium salinisoli TaxID=2878391 RepID=UPI001CF053E8|nr:hypothetical protein [Halomicrobium salinisoli]